MDHELTKEERRWFLMTQKRIQTANGLTRRAEGTYNLAELAFIIANSISRYPFLASLLKSEGEYRIKAAVKALLNARKYYHRCNDKDGLDT